MGKTKLRIVIVALLVAVALITVGCEKVTESKLFTITYELGAGDNEVAATGTVPKDTAKYIAGEEVTTPKQGEMTAPADQHFTGWKTVPPADVTAKDFAIGSAYTVTEADADATTGVITLAATWTTSYTITYAAGGGAGTVPTDTAKYGVGDKVTVKGQGGMTAPSGTPTFTGWNTAASPTDTSTAVAVGGEYTVVAADADATTRAITLHAQWAAAN